MISKNKIEFLSCAFLVLCGIFQSAFSQGNLASSSQQKNSEEQNSSENKNTSEISLDTLLSGYLIQDNTLRKLAIDVQKSQLSLKETKINNGLDITLSSGTMTFYTGATGNSVSIKPSVSARIPTAKNLSASVSTTYEKKSDVMVSAKTGQAVKDDGWKDTKFKIGLDIISSDDAKVKLNIVKSERSLFETRKQLEAKALETEKNFYTKLENILTKINSLYTSLQTVYKDELDFEKIKAQGYTSSSSTYRLAQMKVMSGKHDAESTIHTLKHDITVFYKDCGFDIEIENENDFLKFIPVDIPQVVALDFESFDREQYKEIENAKWVNDYNSLVRKADKYFTLGANAGYTIANSTTKTDTADIGLTTTIGGVGLNAGVSLPITTEDFTPAYTLSATVNPNKFRTRSITKEQYALSEKQELIDIENAEKNYETAIVDFEEKLNKINWETSSVNESFELYAQNEIDLEKYYKMGIVTQSEWLSAKNNRQLYEVKKTINKIDMILYNNEIKSKFYGD